MDLAWSVSSVVVENCLGLLGNVDKLFQLFSNFVESVKKGGKPFRRFSWFIIVVINIIIIIIIIIIIKSVEHRTDIVEVTGSTFVEALILSELLLSNCLKWKIYCDDHSSLSSTTAVQI